MPLLSLLPPPWPEALHWGGRIDSEYVGNLFGGRERNTSADLFAHAHLRVDSKPFGLGQGHFYDNEGVSTTPLHLR